MPKFKVGDRVVEVTLGEAGSIIGVTGPHYIILFDGGSQGTVVPEGNLVSEMETPHAKDNT